MPLVLPNFFCASAAFTALVSAFLTVVIYGSPLVVALKFVSVSFVQLDTITTILIGLCREQFTSENSEALFSLFLSFQ